MLFTMERLLVFLRKNAVKEVKNGLECGISLKDFIDFKEKDIMSPTKLKKLKEVYD